MRLHNRMSALAAAASIGAVLVLAGCGSDPNDEASGTDPVDVPSSTSDVAAVDDLAAQVPDRIKERGTLIAAAEAGYAPFDFYAPDDANTIVGVDPALAGAIAQVLGLKLDMVNTSFDTIIPGIESEKFDLGMSNHDVVEERLKVVDMVGYLAGGVSMLVPFDSTEEYATLDDVCGKRAGISKGEIYAVTLEEQSKKCEAEGKDKISVQVFPTADAVILALTSEKIDFTMNDTAVAEYKASELAKGKIRVSGESFDDKVHGIVVKKDSELTPLVTAALDHLIEDGTYGEILDKWELSSIALDKAVLNSPTR